MVRLFFLLLSVFWLFLLPSTSFVFFSIDSLSFSIFAIVNNFGSSCCLLSLFPPASDNDSLPLPSSCSTLCLIVLTDNLHWFYNPDWNVLLRIIYHTKCIGKIISLNSASHSNCAPHLLHWESVNAYEVMKVFYFLLLSAFC